ncbi:basic leucine zipper 4 [Lactuca sativa]|uniref:basic leucine zipper 4 n=1 Tax=Lactuca sativa TaxID=4236 RepID=UPI000CC26649|nr:basic leucine zipper 4 [Lactuca sativa]
MSSSIFPSTGYHVSFNGYLDDIFSDFPPQNPLLFSSSDNSTQKTNGSSSGSDDCGTNQWAVNMNDERRRKRMISNRESAKRSRVRKQKHLENLKNQVTRYTMGNEELKNRLRFVNHNGQLLKRENDRLRSASLMLQQTLSNLHQLLLVEDLHYPLL